jgi:hypothetical protein
VVNLYETVDVIVSDLVVVILAHTQ